MIVKCFAPKPDPLGDRSIVPVAFSYAALSGCEMCRYKANRRVIKVQPNGCGTLVPCKSCQASLDGRRLYVPNVTNDFFQGKLERPWA